MCSMFISLLKGSNLVQNYHYSILAYLAAIFYSNGNSKVNARLGSLLEEIDENQLLFFGLIGGG